MPETVVVGSSSTLACQSYSSNKLVTIVGRIVGLASDTTLRAGVLDMLNLAIQEVDLETDWEFMALTATDITVTSGTATYTLPSDFKNVYDARLVGGNEKTLDYIDLRSYDRARRLSQTATGVPTHYHFFADFGTAKLTLVPTPGVNDTLRIRYYKTMPILADSASDEFCVPQRYMVPILYKAAELVTAWKSPELSKLWREKYTGALVRAIHDDRTDPDGNDQFVPMIEWAARRIDFTNPDDLAFYPR